MLRESVVGLPYFKPKQKSLQEFLNRKKGTPEVVQSIKIAHFSPQDDRLLQQRQKQLEEFYKQGVNEDESDEDYNEGRKESATREETVIQEADTREEILTESTEERIAGNNEDNSRKGVDGENDQDTAALCEKNLDLEGTSSVEDLNLDKSTEPGLNAAPSVDNESEENGVGESLHLVMEDTPNLSADAPEDVTVLTSSQPAPPATTAESRLAAKLRLTDPSLEQTLNITPKLGSGNLQDDDFFTFSSPSMSTGAQQLFERFVTHAKAKGPPVHLAAAVRQQVEPLSILTKQVNSEGVEVLNKETILYKRAGDAASRKKMSYESLKDKLRQEMLEKRRAERQRRDEILKLNNEEYGDELPDEEEVLEEFEEDEEGGGSDEDSGEAESEPEENDVVLKDKKSRKSLFVDEEAEESDQGNDEEEDDDDEDDDENDEDDESLHLAQEEDDEDSGPEDKSAVKKLKGSYRKIRAADLLSEDSNTCSQAQPPEGARTPVAGHKNDVTPLAEAGGGGGSLHFSNLSSASSSVMNTEPRWTPFTERMDSVEASGEAARRRTPSAAGGGSGRESESPTSSQLARKRLGFEGNMSSLVLNLEILFSCFSA
jgi:hypothetical protein